MSDPVPPEREILTDLIAELRARHPAGDYCCCGWCDRDKEAADRAEARLREVSGDGDE